MRGAYKHWAVNGAKRLGQQAVYFAVPFGLGKSSTPPPPPPLPPTNIIARARCSGYALIQWAIKDNHLRNSKHGQAQGLFP